MPVLKRVLFGSPWFYLVARVLLALIFIYAGGVKLMDPRAFARTISGYNLVPSELLVPVAIGLPAIELLAGLGLIFNVRGCLKIISGLLVMFVVILGYGIINDLNVDCGCFSAEELQAKDSLRTALIRDIGMLMVVSYLFAWRWFHRRPGVQNRIQV
jgi:hypothetical protein